jgi:multisubunit Na+/H+ antiporter MnhB subunit
MVARNWFSDLTGPIAWSAVVAGVFVALVVHILLNMLGAGIGASSMEVRTPTQGEAQAIGWGAFAWWSISGIIAAFAGGWAAGLLAAGQGSPNGALHGFLSWAVTTVVVITGAAIQPARQRLPYGRARVPCLVARAGGSGTRRGL